MTTLIHTFFGLIRCLTSISILDFIISFSLRFSLEQNHINGIVVNASAGIMQDLLHILCTKIIVIIMPKNAHKLYYNDVVISLQHIGIISWDVDSHFTLTGSIIYSTWTIIIISQVFDSDSRPKINTFKVNKLVMQQRD